MKHKGHLEVVNPDTGEVGDKRVWMVNNQIVFTDDGFKTSKTTLGEFTVDGETYYGLIAQAVLAGYIEGSQIKGGTIQIGLQDDGTYAFEVHEDGSVTMHGGSSISGYAKEETVNNLGNQIQKIETMIDGINNAKMYRVEIISSGSMVMSALTTRSTLTCKVYSWDSDITDTLDDTFFNWKRVSDNTELDNIWNSMPEHQNTKYIEIDSTDVPDGSSASFTCEVELPD